MQKSERDVRKAISDAVRPHLDSGVSLSFGGNSRGGEAVLKKGESVSRVFFNRSSSRHDIAGVVGRVRRALRKIGVGQVEMSPISIGVADAKPTTRTNADLYRMVLALESRVLTLEERLSKAAA